MIILRAVLLGMLQAFTEFFPLSNTAHIILLQRLFNYHKTYMAYDVVIDAGTVLAIIVYYSRDIRQMISQAPALLKVPFMKNKNELFWDYPYALMVSFLGLSSVATGVVRLIFYEAGETLHRWTPTMGVIWILMGLLLFASRKIKGGQRTTYEMNHQDAFLIGVAQGFTVFPGISRIGITIIVAMALGIQRKEAARYCFLLGAVYITIALLYKMVQGTHFYQSDQTALFVSFLASLAAGIFVQAFAVKMIENGKYYLWAYYCFAVGLFAIVLPFLKLNF